MPEGILRKLLTDNELAPRKKWSYGALCIRYVVAGVKEEVLINKKLSNYLQKYIFDVYLQSRLETTGLKFLFSSVG